MIIKHSAIATAVVLALGVASFGAQASIGTATRTFAVEQFLGSTPAATAITLAPISYQFSGPVAAGSTFYVYVGLSGGAKFTAAPAVTDLIGSAADGAAISSAVGAAGGAVSAPTLLTDGSVRFTVALAPGKAISSISVFTFTPTLSTVNTANGALGTVGGMINATWVNNSTAVTAAIPAGDIDTAGTHTGPVATSAQGIAVTAASSAAFPFNTGGVAETSRINVASTPAGSQLTTGANTGSTTVVNLGAVRFTNGSAVQNDGATAYTIASQTGATSLNYTVSAPAGFFAALGTTGFVELSSTPNCGTPLATSKSTLFGTAGAAAAATAITVTGAAQPTTGTNYYVCLTANGTTPLVTGTPSFTATLTKTSTATDSNNVLAATNLYPLRLNGTQVDVTNYVPAAVTGWTQFIRVANTGSVAASVFASVIDETTGTAGTPVAVINNLLPGAVMNLTSTQIEAAVGAQPEAARPRIRITAPTNALKVQNMLFTPNGSFTNNSSVE